MCPRSHVVIDEHAAVYLNFGKSGRSLVADGEGVVARKAHQKEFQ